ncbi:MAG: TerB family tellurite resistance protein [Candidatus Omnitrophica bacterium]|nr:TerB family tellurite resistance protein [Candidatus Omnitrophota bacterium]
MAGFLDNFRKKVVSSIWKDGPEERKVKDIDDKIALGVLLWVVAEADEKFLPEEEKKIREILSSYAKISDEDMLYVMNSIKEAAKERIDMYHFTHEVSQDLSYNVKVSIIERLFSVACADKDLDDNEYEVIRKISGLFNLTHSDFINAKIKVKKEFGLDTAGL